MKSYFLHFKRDGIYIYCNKITGYNNEVQFLDISLKDNFIGYDKRNIAGIIHKHISPLENDVYIINIIDIYNSLDERRYYLGHDLHREDGPARIIYDTEHGEKFCEDFYLNNIFIGRDLKLDNLEDIKNYQIMK